VMMIMVTKRKTKTTKKKRTTKTSSVSKDAIIKRIKKHKLRFDIDYEKGIYDLTPKEADIYDDSIDDILRIIRKM
jgi:hypothetical protein